MWLLGCGYDPGAAVGLGFKIWVIDDETTCDDVTAPTRWKVKAFGKGNVVGGGFIFAELLAFQSLLVTIVALRKRNDIDIEQCLGVPTAIRALSGSDRAPWNEISLVLGAQALSRTRLMEWHQNPESLP